MEVEQRNIDQSTEISQAGLGFQVGSNAAAHTFFVTLHKSGKTHQSAESTDHRCEKLHGLTTNGSQNNSTQSNGSTQHRMEKRHRTAKDIKTFKHES